MLNSVKKLFLRFILCWLIFSTVVTLLFYIKSRLNYKYKLNDEWKYQLSYKYSDLLVTFSIGFFFLFVIYFSGLLFFKRLNSPRNKIVYSFVLFASILFLFSLMSISSLFKDLWASLYTFIIFGILGLIVAIMDNLLVKILPDYSK